MGLVRPEEWAQLKDDARAKRRAVTMRCGSPDLAKTRKLGTLYFAHSPGGVSCCTGDSSRHLLAKALIIEAVTRAGWTAGTGVPGGSHS
jgi:hypothetical protein